VYVPVEDDHDPIAAPVFGELDHPAPFDASAIDEPEEVAWNDYELRVRDSAASRTLQNQPLNWYSKVVYY